MASLRDMLDGKTIWAQAPPPSPKKPTQSKSPTNGMNPASSGPSPSPAAQHVADHMTDPFGATKDMVNRLNQKKMQYEQEKNDAVMRLLPVHTMLQGLTESHRLDTPDANPIDEGMGYSDPNNPNGGMVDPVTGQPIQGQDPNGGMGGGVPGNMGQTPGQMNMNRPSQSGFQPGVAPGFPANQVRPAKFGLPRPGQGQQGNFAGNPQQTMPGGGPNPQQNQFNPQAGSPPGAKQLPGAKGPNDPKVQNQVKKAQGNSNGGSGKSGSGSPNNSKGKVNIQVHADSIPMRAATPIAAWAGVDKLRSCNDGKKMDAYGTTQGVEKAWQVRQRGSTNPRTKERMGSLERFYKQADKDGRLLKPSYGSLQYKWGKSKEMEAYIGSGMNSKNTKTTTTFVSNQTGNMPNAGNSMKAYTGSGMSGKNPDVTTTFKTNQTGNMPNSGNSMKGYGTSEGVQKAWQSRGHGRKETQTGMDKGDLLWPRNEPDKDSKGSEEEPDQWTKYSGSPEMMAHGTSKSATMGWYKRGRKVNPDVKDQQDRNKMWQKIRDKNKGEMTGGKFKASRSLRSAMIGVQGELTPSSLARGGRVSSRGPVRMKSGESKQGWERPLYPDTPSMSAKRRMNARMENLTQ